MCTEVEDALDKFASKHRFRGKGALCVALVTTEHARTRGLPLDSNLLVTDGGGQVLGLGKAAVQAILKRHGIEKILAAEGGRTSRGSLSRMREYVAFLNNFHARHVADLDAIETYWIGCVRAFFASRPFTVKLDASRSLCHVVSNLLEQAVGRQADTFGVNYAGAVLQHLVGAKLAGVLTTEELEINSFSTADAPSDRIGDFSIGDVAIHVTTAPSEALIERCMNNLNDGYKPIIVTVPGGLSFARGLARNRHLEDRIDIFEIEQFVALNLYEKGNFRADGRRAAVEVLVTGYNQIIDDVETDPSLRIEFRK